MRRTLIPAVALLAVALGLSACGSSKSGSDNSTTTTNSAYTTPASTGAQSSSGAPAGVTLSGKVNDKGTKTFPSGTPSAAALEDNGSNYVEVNDNYFEPTYIKGAPGSTVQLGLENVGKNAHTFTIKSMNIDEVLPPKAKKTVTVTIPKSGFTEFICTYHAEGGMRGALVAAS